MSVRAQTPTPYRPALPVGAAASVRKPPPLRQRRRNTGRGAFVRKPPPPLGVVRKPPPAASTAANHPLKTIVAACACAAVTLTEIFDAFNSPELSVRRTTAFPCAGRTLRVVNAICFDLR